VTKKANVQVPRSESGPQSTIPSCVQWLGSRHAWCGILECGRTQQQGAFLWSRSYRRL